MMNKLPLIQARLTVAMETVQADHMALRALEHHHHIPDRQSNPITSHLNA